MRSALWSVAFAVGSVFAAPQWGSNEPAAQGFKGKGLGYKQAGHYGADRPSSSSTDEEAKATVATPTYAHAEQSTTFSAAPSRFAHSLSGNSSSYSAAAAAAAEYPKTKVTRITTVSTTVCPVTTTGVQNGMTIARTYETTSTVTYVLTSTLTVKPVATPTGYALSESKCAAYDTTITEITAVYASPYPGTYTDAGGTVYTYAGTETVTSVKTLTVVVSQPTGAADYGSGNAGSSNGGSGSQDDGSESDGAGEGASGSQNGGSNIGKGGNGGSNNDGSGSQDDGSTSDGTGEGASGSQNGGSNTGKGSNGGSNTGDSGALPTGKTGSLLPQPSEIWSYVPWGTTMLSYTIPATTSGKGSNGGSNNGDSGALPTSKTGSNLPQPSEIWSYVPWGTTMLSYTIPATTSESPVKTSAASSPSGTAPSVTAPFGTAPSGTASSGTAPSVTAPSGTAPSVTAPFGTAPSGTAPSGTAPFGTAPSGTAPFGTAPSGTAPSGTAPFGTAPSGTAPATHTSSSTSTCSKPTETPMVDGMFQDCVPCEGQPGSDPDQFCGYTIHDNWYEVTPKTCRVREYHFEMTNTTVAPDGVPRVGLVINGQLPGPKIEASWGDTIIVHVKNSMQNNGTSLHFHGVRQYWTNEMDGVASITQCPIAPGDSMTYTFTATNYGTSWYHSHFSIQTYEGIFGPMTIHGPAAEEYDFEETVVVQDWSHATADSMYQAAQTVGTGPSDSNHGPRTLDTGLINGMNIWGSDEGYNTTGAMGKRWEMNVISGKTYRLRLVNTAIQSTFKFYIDGHKFKVIANDFVPIVPYETNIVNINIGQRYDLIFKADQPIGNYWMRADNQNVCAVITHADNIRGIVRYVGALPLAVPTSTAYKYTPECVDEPLASLVPIVPRNAGPAADQTIDKTVVVGTTGGTPNLYKWTLSGTTFQSLWADPTLSSIVKNGSVPDYSGNLAIEVPKLKEWVYVIIDSPIPLPHPIHLHGHDFLILAQGKGMYSSDVVLNTVNPPRRDVALMPGDAAEHTGGHLVLAFESDNPGVWLMHCHIGWHVAMGFALQIIENLEGIKKTVKESCQLEDTCKNWLLTTHAHDFDIRVVDSGV